VAITAVPGLAGGRRRACNMVLCVAVFAVCSGCSDSSWPLTTKRAPTYSEDVAPVLATHCISCHRPGHAAPFPLTTFAEVRPRATQIAAAVESRRMPPWLPDFDNPPIIGQRRLSDAERTAILGWVNGGAQEGGPARLEPPRPAEWEFGAPDLVAAMPRPYVLAAEGHDVYRNVVLRPNLTAKRFVRALEFNPGAAAVHHAVIRIDRTRSSRARDGADGQPGFDGMAAYEVQDPDGHFLGWAPGRGPIVAPPDLPWVLDPGSDLVIELHLMPGSTQVKVQPSVALYFTDRAPARTPVVIVMGSKAIDIPAGAADYAIEDRFQLPVDVEVLSVYPHAHYLGRSMEVRAASSDGTTRQLLRVQRWSFNWQQDYRFVTPIALPRGTTIAMRYTYDNSDRNPANPQRPPRRVTWGPQSHDEMGNLGVQLLTRTPADAVELARSFDRHAAAIDVAGAEAMVKADPGNPSHAAFLGTSYIRVGRLAEAIAPLERALGLDPSSATNENHLAGALLALGRTSDALAHLRTAVGLAPQDAHLRFNLAKVLASTGRSQEAFEQYTRALALDPGLAEAHQHIGVLHFGAGRVHEAIGHLTRAAELAPTSASVHADLGGALAQAGRFEEALRHVRRALELDPADATARENLARLERLTPR
jgi:Flp pilus assembly protein TadD